MLCRVRKLQHRKVEATDGPIGAIHSLLFDDVGWVIRYLAVDTGHWLPGRRVLLSPISVERHGIRGRLHVALTREQIRRSPGIDSDQPVSRQMESALNAPYGYAPYWGGASIWGAALYPAALAAVTPMPAAVTTADGSRDFNGGRQRSKTDPHLRSSRAIFGDHLAASDGAVGHVDDFLFDASSWIIWRLVVDTSDGPGGRSVMLKPGDVRGIDWHTSTVHVDLTRERVLRSAEFRAEEVIGCGDNRG
jgi:hypothetical protein